MCQKKIIQACHQQNFFSYLCIFIKKKKIYAIYKENDIHKMFEVKASPLV